MGIEVYGTPLPGTDEVIRVLAFRAGDQSFCVDISTVQEIRAGAGVTPVPDTPEYVLGVITQARGVSPVVDLRARFGKGRTHVTARHMVVLVAVEGGSVGLLAEAVSDILSVATTDVHPVPIAGSPDANVLSGLISHGDQMLCMIDAAQVLNRFDTRMAA